MSSKYTSVNVVNYKDFDIKHLVTPEPESKTAANPAKVPEGKGLAFEIPILYNHVVKSGDKELTNTGSLTIRCPEIKTVSGVKFETKEGKLCGTIFVAFDMTDPDQAEYVGTFPTIYEPQIDGKEDVKYGTGVLGSMYEWAAERFYNYLKYQAGKKKSREDIGDEMFLPQKTILWRKKYDSIKDKTDPELDGQYVPDSNPTKYLKLRIFGTPGTPEYNEAKFYTGNGKLVKLTDLESRSFKFVPHILWRRIWIGKTKSIQHDVTGGIISEIFEKVFSLPSHIEETRRQLLSRNPDMGDKVESLLFAALDKKPEVAADKSETTEEVSDGDEEDAGKSDIKSRLAMLQGVKK